jgi:hypothetical protein
MWYGEITIEQVYNLEEIFAEFKEGQGWTIPPWLIQLKKDVNERDARRALEQINKG